MEQIIKQGEDHLLEIPLMRGTAPALLNPSLVLDIRAKLTINNASLAQFALGIAAGFDTLDYNPTQAHVINIPLTRDQSKDFPPGYLRAVIVVNHIDADFPQGRHEEFTHIIGRVTAGDGKDLYNP